MNKVDLAKKIYAIQSLELFQQIFEMANWELSKADYKVELFEADILNALEDLSEENLITIQKKIAKYRKFTAVHVQYGYENIYATSKREALKKADTSPNKIFWRSSSYCLRLSPSRYVHQIKLTQIKAGKKRVTYDYDKNDIMSEEEIKDFLINSISKNVIFRGECQIEYVFIKDSIVKFEKIFNVNF